MKFVLGAIAWMSGIISFFTFIAIPLTIGFFEREDIAIPDYALQWTDIVQLVIAGILILGSFAVARSHRRRLVISAILLVLLTAFDALFAMNMASMDDGRKLDGVLLQYLFIALVAFVVAWSCGTAAQRTIR